MENRQTVDMALTAAFLCAECDVVTSAPQKCMRCGSTVYPLTQWIKPAQSAATTAQYSIVQCFVDDEDGALTTRPIVTLLLKYFHEHEAIKVIARLWPGAVPVGKEDSDFYRLPILRLFKIDNDVFVAIRRN